MLEFFELNDLSSYLLFASMLVKIAILIGFITYLKVYLTNRSTFHPKHAHYDDIKVMQSQRLPNENNSFRNWLALCARYKESPDEGPSHFLLESKTLQFIQGGRKWVKYQITMYPLLLKG